MYLNSLYRKFLIVGLSILLVFIIGLSNNEVHAQKVNLKQKIASIKWPSILKGKRISLDDSLNQQSPQPKVKKQNIQAPPKQPKVQNPRNQNRSVQSFNELYTYIYSYMIMAYSDFFCYIQKQ